MSRTPSTLPSEDPRDDTPPHGVPPVTRAAIAPRPPRRDDVAEPDSEPDEEWLAPDGPARRDGHSGGAAAAALGEDADRQTADGADEGGPVRVTRRHAGRVLPKERMYEPGTRRHLRFTRRARVVGAVLAVLLVVAGFLAWYEVEANPFGKPGKAVLVDVHSGESLSAITSTMQNEGVIGTSFAFHLWAVVHGAPLVRPGTYQLHRNSSFATAKTVLAAGPNVIKITVVPGTTVSELTNQLASLPGNLAHVFSHGGSAAGVHSPFQPSAGAALEGLIGSGTYRILPGESGRTLLAQMVDRFDAEARSAGLTPATTVNGLDAYQLVTLASISQKEGYYTRYMGDVSRVIFNRLASGMRLDMTSTVLYSLGKDGGQVTPQEEQLTTPYNTYLHAGLTPTPICTPSVQALRAAVHPPAGSWLYFDLVTSKNGIMKFASTYTQQLALVQEAAANAAKQSSSGTSSAPSSGSTT